MTINKLTALEQGNAANSNGGDVAASVNVLIDSSRYLVSQPPLSRKTLTGVTITPELVASALPRTFDKLGFQFSNLGGAIVQAGAGFPDNQFITSVGTVDSGSGVGIAAKFVKSFYFYGDKFEIKYKEILSLFTILVDNQYSGEVDTVVTTGQVRYASVSFTSSEFRRIDILCDNALIGDVFTDNSDVVYATKSSKKTVIVGDSFTEGTGAPRTLGYAEYMRYLTGSYDIVNSGSGGTGYLKDNAGRPNLVDRVQTDVIDQAPDVVIIAMGVNDTGLDINLVRVAIQTVYAAIKSGLPNAAVICLGSFTSGEALANMVAVTAVIEQEAAISGFKFINPTGTGNADGWFTGTGNVSAPNGTGNADILISGDDSHPTGLGHHHLAARLLQSLFDINVVI